MTGPVIKKGNFFFLIIFCKLAFIRPPSRLLYYEHDPSFKNDKKKESMIYNSDKDGLMIAYIQNLFPLNKFSLLFFFFYKQASKLSSASKMNCIESVLIYVRNFYLQNYHCFYLSVQTSITTKMHIY